MTENLAGRGEGLAGLVAQFRCLAENVLMRYKSNPQYAGEIFHTEDVYHDLLKLCAALEAAAPASTASKRDYYHEAIEHVLAMRKVDLQRAHDPALNQHCEYYFGRAHRCDDVLFWLGHIEASIPAGKDSTSALGCVTPAVADEPAPDMSSEYSRGKVTLSGRVDVEETAALATPSPQAPGPMNSKGRWGRCTNENHGDSQEGPCEQEWILDVPAATQEQPAGSGASVISASALLYLLRQVIGTHPLPSESSEQGYRRLVQEIWSFIKDEGGSPRKVGEDGAFRIGVLLSEKIWQLRERGKELAKNPQEYFRGMADGFESVANELEALARGTFSNQLSDAELERLAVLSEELGEAQQYIGKIIRHGYESGNPLVDYIANRTQLEREIGDIQAAIGMMVHAKDVSESEIERRIGKKLVSIQRWLHHQSVKKESQSGTVAGEQGVPST